MTISHTHFRTVDFYPHFVDSYETQWLADALGFNPQLTETFGLRYPAGKWLLAKSGQHQAWFKLEAGNCPSSLDSAYWCRSLNSKFYEIDFDAEWVDQMTPDIAFDRIREWPFNPADINTVLGVVARVQGVCQVQVDAKRYAGFAPEYAGDLNRELLVNWWKFYRDIENELMEAFVVAAIARFDMLKDLDTQTHGQFFYAY